VQSNQRRSGGYGLGGIPRQDLASSIVNTLRSAGTGMLRGYQPGAFRGHQYHLANLEYRVPLWTIEKGPDSVPIYLRRLHLAGLGDVGNAFDGPFDPRDLKVALGISLRLEVVFGFFAGGAFDLGWARGLMDGGENQFWLHLTQGI